MIIQKSVRVLQYVVLAIAAVLVIYPLWFTFAAALMSTEEASHYPPSLYPHALYWKNFGAALQMVPILRFISNSFIISFVVMVAQVITASLAAYAFSFVRFYGKNFWFVVFLSTMMIPWEVTIIPNYLTIKSLNWLNTYQGLMVPFFASAFGVFMLRQYFLQLPKDLFEAAKVDGCGHVRYFFSMVLPLSRPALATLGVYVFLQMWNMYLWPLLITSTAEMRTVQIGISMLQWQENMSWNLVLAGIAIVLLPSLLLLVLGLKQLVRGIMSGAVKA
ncbi:MAG: glycerol-3-phosphate ABC transporter permease [Paenibacillus sp. RIFOXYA1_FULL_44_5]|nr:MAG: glycerol-3-phosphate ABC transporter permease [Paenibacillus sp. RIFOXYA1_FULL_44_5]